MKRFIQLSLILIIIIISFFFYKKYFQNEKKIILENKKSITNDELSEKSEHNLIKNLKYEVKLDQNKQYIITADLSEITYENNAELVKMQKVKAVFIDQDKIPITVTSETAVYNSLNYNTSFRKNVKIKYIDNIIVADKMDLNFEDNIIKVFENVKYNGLKIDMKTDNIKINLITKKIDIYMSDSAKKVEFETK